LAAGAIGDSGELPGASHGHDSMTPFKSLEEYARYIQGLSLGQLEDIALHLDKDMQPERYQAVLDLISQRRSGSWGKDERLKIDPSTVDSGGLVQEQTSQLPEPPPELSLEFHGSVPEYFRIWIVNLCLTLLTFGIFSAWAKVRKKRYLYSHTTLDGTPFQYLGQPIPILKGRVIAAIGFLAYYTSSHLITSMLPYVLAGGVIVAPWVIVRSAAFNARYSAFRNMTFHFGAGYLEALKVLYAWGTIPALAIGMIFNGLGKPTLLGITSAVFAFSYPWWIRRLKRFIIEHTSYGGKKGAFFATGRQFFKIYFISGLIMVAVLVLSAKFAGMLVAFTMQLWLLTYLIAAPMYAGYVLAFAYVQARSGNLVWNHTRLGPLRFQSTLRWRDLLKLYVTNALGIVASFGLLIPWAVIRTMKYRADNMQVLLEGELSEFQGSDKSAVIALGAETVDFFDVDLSL
jgi:uncharacterized membrane protein YjgN (DUF898 family)